jgi:hypothetical protein
MRFPTSQSRPPLIGVSFKTLDKNQDKSVTQPTLGRHHTQYLDILSWQSALFLLNSRTTLLYASYFHQFNIILAYARMANAAPLCGAAVTQRVTATLFFIKKVLLKKIFLLSKINENGSPYPEVTVVNLPSSLRSTIFIRNLTSASEG